ncbi:MAG: S8 family serine peptidase [Isosphaeraceae bacterium]
MMRFLEILSLAITCMACAAIDAGAAPFTPLAYQTKPVKWNRDANQNSIEDYIDNLIAAAQRGEGNIPKNIDVIVALNQSLTANNLNARFNAFGEVAYVGRYMTFLVLRGVALEQIQEIAEMDVVALVEYDWPLVLGLDDSTAAVQVRASRAYPNSIETRFPSVTGTGVGVAVLDSGVNNRNPTDTVGHVYFPPGRFRAGFDAIENDETDPADGHGHGTHVASIVLGGGGTTGIFRGVAHEANLIDMRVLDSSNRFKTSDSQRALEKCIEMRNKWNIRVLNMSYGGGVNDDGTSTHAQLANYAVLRGIVVVSITHNQGKRLIPAPASGDDVIAVGNVDHNGTVGRGDDVMNPSSNYGPRDDDEDGSDIDEQKPSLVAPGTSITGARHSSDTATIVFSGTSMAAPHVAGLAALVIQRQPRINPLSVHDLLIRTASPHGASEWDTKSGYGTINGYESIRLLTAFDDSESPEPAGSNLAVSDDIAFPSRADPSWVSPDISTASPPVVGKKNTVRCKVKNLGSKNATKVRLTVGVYIYGNGNESKYYAIAQKRFDLAAGKTSTISVDWTPQASPTGNRHACLYAEIGYGVDKNFGNNKARRNIEIAQKSRLADVDHVVAVIENNLDQEAKLTVVGYEVDPENGFKRAERPVGVLADSMTFRLAPTDPEVAIPLRLPALARGDDEEVARHIDFVVTATLSDGTDVEHGGFRAIQSSDGGQPPAIDVDGEGIVLRDVDSGIAFVNVTEAFGGTIDIPSFVPGEREVRLAIERDEASDFSCRLEVWDCCLNRSEREVRITK